MKKTLILLLSLSLFYGFFATPLLAIPLTESETGLTVDAPKKYSLTHVGDGLYRLKKKGSKNRADFVIGRSPFDAEGTADDYIESSGMKVKKYQRLSDSVLLTGKVKKKATTVRFRPVGDQMEVVTYFGKNKKKKSKKKRRRRSARSTPETASLTLGQLQILDRIIRTRQGGNVVPLPVTIPSRQLVGQDGTSALVPNLPGWQAFANDGIISAGHPQQGIANLGIPTLVGVPGSFFGGVTNRLVPANLAILEIWPKQIRFVDPTASVQVVNIQEIPGTIGWLGQGFNSAMFAVRFNHVGLTWDALFVSGVAPVDSFSYLWYHSYIAVPVGSSPHIANALMNTWATWNNTQANQQRFQETINTIRTTPLPGGVIDQGVFDEIHQKWVDFIKQ